MTKASTARRTKRVAKKAAAKSNGKANGVIGLEEHEADQMRKEKITVDQLKFQLGDVRSKRDELEKREKELCRQIASAGESLQATAKEIAENHGIDVEKGGWTLQIDKGRFVRAPGA